MAKGRGTQINLDPPKTVAAMGTDDCFVPGWDSRPGALQHNRRLSQRQAMGNKMTPTGPSRLRPNRRGQ